MRPNLYDVTFQDFNLTTPLRNALDDMEFTSPTPIQEKAYSVILSGRDVLGIAQTGTGKTMAYLLPLLKELKYSTQQNPRILVVVPTRELVAQVIDVLGKIGAYLNIRSLGVYGGTNINTQKQQVAQGQDIIVATPGRLYDLAINRDLKLKSIQKLVIDEVDMMLDLGFKFQLNNILELLPSNRQNIMFSATLNPEVEKLIAQYFRNPVKISAAAPGAPLDTIEQHLYRVPNFNTKVNLLKHFLADRETFRKNLVFTENKKFADKLSEELEKTFPDQVSVAHSNKSQNYRFRSLAHFEEGRSSILITTDVMARGLDMDDISHVINFDTPAYPENYIHRIGRTGRAQRTGNAILLSTPKEKTYLENIEVFLGEPIHAQQLPEAVEIADQLIPEELPRVKEINNPTKFSGEDEPGPAFHEKSEKNKKVNLGGSYRREISKKYKKPKTRGDKNFNRRKKR